MSEKKVPDEKLMSVLVAQDGKVYIELLGTKDSILKSEDLREKVLLNAVGAYNKAHPGSNINLSEKDVETFRKTNAFGVPFASLAEWLKHDVEERDKLLKSEGAGIPIAENFDITRPTEFQIWVKAVSDALEEANVADDMKKGSGIAIKADANTPYDRVQVVMNNLQTIKMNKFTLMTALKKEE